MGNPSMYHLMYVSYATKTFTDNDLTELLFKARKNNANLAVTGMLIFRDGNFIQILEGEKKTVKDLYRLIESDKRHNGSIVISDGEIPERQFGNWAMNFRRLRSHEIFTDFEMAQDKYGVLSVLTNFIKNMS